MLEPNPRKPPTMHGGWVALRDRLERWRGATRLRQWPSGNALKLAVFDPLADPAHLPLFLDAAESFHPRSETWIFRPSSTGWDEAALGRLREEFKGLTLKRGAGDESGRFDAAILLHPWPGIVPEAADRLREMRSAHWRSRAAREWILFRDLELWDGSMGARLLRRLVDPALGPLRRRVERDEDAVLERFVLPRLAEALAWNGDAPCRHPRAAPLISHPRRVLYCPECGMGVTPATGEPTNQESDDMYGPGYALHFRYTGWREWQRYADECCRRVEGYLRALGFEEDALRPEERAALDYGCGGGRYGRLWAGRGWRYVGADFSDANIEFARAWAGRGLGGAAEMEFCRGGLEHPGVARRAPYGMAFLSHVLEHVPEPGELLARLRELTRPGGWLYVEVPDAGRYTWSKRHRGFANAEHRWDFTPRMLAATAREAGWTEIRVQADPDGEQFPFVALLARRGRL